MLVAAQVDHAVGVPDLAAYQCRGHGKVLRGLVLSCDQLTGACCQGIRHRAEAGRRLPRKGRRSLVVGGDSLDIRGGVATEALHHLFDGADVMFEVGEGCGPLGGPWGRPV